MLHYITCRLLQMVLVFFGTTLLIYVIVFALPGDPIVALGGQRSLSSEVVDQIEASYHLDKPFIVQYLLYLKGLFAPDLGRSLRGTESALDVLVRAHPVTIKLSLMALAFEAIAGIGFGLIVGVRKGGWFDATVLVFSLVVIAVLTFVTGFALQFIVGIRPGWLSAIAGESPGLTELLMSAVVLGTAPFAYVLRLVRTEVAENLAADYVCTARARGLSGARVMIVHAPRNSLVSVVIFLGADLGALMGGAIVTEDVSNTKGVGDTPYSVTTCGDGPMVVSFTTVLVPVFIVFNLLVDLFYAALDPRIHYA